MKMQKILCGLLFACCLVFLPADQLKWSSWTILKPGVLSSWDVVEYPDTGSRLSLLPRGTASSAGLKKVLLLYSKKSSAYDTALDTILRVFLDKNIKAFVTLVYYANKAEEAGRALAFAEAEKYDLIFSMGSDATAFVHKNYKNGAIPVVTVCSKDPVLQGQMQDYENGSGTNIAYTSLDMNTKLQLEYLLKLKKNLKHIVILSAAANKSVINTQVIPLRTECEKIGIACYDLVVEDQKKAGEELAEKMPLLIARIKAADPDLTGTIFWITGTTEIFGEIETIVRCAGGIPVLSVVPDVVAEGDNSAVLSLGISFESNAHKAALYAVEILDGRSRPGDLPVGVVSPPDMAINFRKAKQIGLAIPFSFFESATIIYDNDGRRVRP